MVANEVIKDILEKFRTVAVVGLSRNLSKDSYGVVEYLQQAGYRVNLSTLSRGKFSGRRVTRAS